MTLIPCLLNEWVVEWETICLFQVQMFVKIRMPWKGEEVWSNHYHTDFLTGSIWSLPIPESQHPRRSEDKNEAALPQDPCFTMEIHTLFGVRWWRWEATFCKMLVLIHLPGAGTGCPKSPSPFSPVMDGVQVEGSGLAMVTSLES